METKKILGFVVAIVSLLLAMSFVAAGNLNVEIKEVSVNDVSSLDFSENETLVLSGYPEESVPVVVKFTANEDLTDLKLKVWIDGYKSEISASTARFNVVNGSTYIKRLSLDLPSVEDLGDDLTEGLTLHVRLANTNDEVESTYDIEVERNSYAYDLLSVDGPSKASAGELIALDVVLRNIGASELEDSFVTASIPELGVSKKVYFGDLTPVDCTDNCDKENARERRIYLVIPADAISGDYILEVKASNYDASATVRKTISVSGVSSASNSTAINAGTSSGKLGGIPTSILVLTIVLVIIFVVLLVILVVLLAKKPSAEKSEEFGETSYY